ncbi:MAG: glycosyltransferase family 2 protein [Anaerolineae bacterium]
MPDLGVAIVTWNARDVIQACLDSLFAHAGGLSIQVVVVDNASSDGTVELIECDYPWVTLIANTENLGFAAASNQALPLLDAPYLMLLNPDTVVHSGALRTLSCYLDEHPTVAAVGPKVVHPAMRLQVLSCGYQPSVRTVINQYAGLSRLFPERSAFRGVNLLMGLHDDRPREVEWLSGVCLMVRRSVVTSVGLLSERWFMYAEDMDWSHRMRQAGWRLYHVPQAVIEHHLGHSAAKNARVSTMWVTSQRSFYREREDASWLQKHAFDAALAGGLLLRSILYGVRGFLGGTDADMWRGEARRFWAYARTALKPLRSES